MGRRRTKAFAGEEHASRESFAAPDRWAGDAARMEAIQRHWAARTPMTGGTTNTTTAPTAQRATATKGASGRVAIQTTSWPKWKAYGGFTWETTFQPTRRNGWIVQELVNTYRAEDTSGTSIGGRVEPHYWEAWRVDADGAITSEGEDRWRRWGRGPGTKGSWSMDGRLYWTTVDPAAMGFSHGGVPDAGTLLSTNATPGRLGPAVGRRHVTGAWDDVSKLRRTHKGTADWA